MPDHGTTPARAARRSPIVRGTVMWIYGRIPDADAPDAHTPFAVRLLLEDGAIVHHAFDSVPEDLAIGDRIVTLLPGRATRQPA